MAMECLTPVALVLLLCVYVSFEQPEYTLDPPTSECVEYYQFREMCPQSYGNESWWFSGIPSLYACAARCQEDTNCLSFVYTGGNDECTTNAEKATTFNDTCEENVMYGQLESVKCNLARVQNCSSDSFCLIDNSYCDTVTARCQCMVGYTFESRRDTCVLIKHLDGSFRKSDVYHRFYEKYRPNVLPDPPVTDRWHDDHDTHGKGKKRKSLRN